MSQNNKMLNKMKWAARIVAVAILAFGLPFYFGYGNPLPFMNPAYTLWDNVWLTIFPITFIGLTVGLKFEKIGGYLVTIPVGLGLLMGLLMQGELVVHMIVPLAVGVLYLFVGYKKLRGIEFNGQ
jgi:hypothetical protein